MRSSAELPDREPMPRDRRALIWAIGLSAVALLVPPLQIVLLPVLYLNTHLHELCHALMAVASGGRAQEIQVFSNGSGVTPVAVPGILGSWLVASAGYTGATIIGGAMIVLSRTAPGARLVLGILAAALAFSMVFWVRGDIVGVFSGLFWIAALIAAFRFLPPAGQVFAGQFLGVQQCLNAMQSVWTLFQISRYEGTASDARIMADTTGLPPIFWAFGWVILSLVVVTAALRRAWRPVG